MKYIREMLLYHFSSEKTKETPNKVELVGDVTEFFRKDCEDLVQREGGGESEGLVQKHVGGLSVVINEAGDQMGKISGFLVYLEYN